MFDHGCHRSKEHFCRRVGNNCALLRGRWVSVPSVLIGTGPGPQHLSSATSHEGLSVFVLSDVQDPAHDASVFRASELPWPFQVHFPRLISEGVSSWKCRMALPLPTELSLAKWMVVSPWLLLETRGQKGRAGNILCPPCLKLEWSCASHQTVLPDEAARSAPG